MTNLRHVFASEDERAIFLKGVQAVAGPLTAQETPGHYIAEDGREVGVFMNSVHVGPAPEPEAPKPEVGELFAGFGMRMSLARTADTAEASLKEFRGRFMEMCIRLDEHLPPGVPISSNLMELLDVLAEQCEASGAAKQTLALDKIQGLSVETLHIVHTNDLPTPAPEED
jgi:hypothetical protein